jgi:hypothetical protein
MRRSIELEKRAEELEKDFTKHALYQAYIESGKSFLEIWRPSPGQKAN